MTKKQAAIIKRWGRLWTALGAPNLYVGVEGARNNVYIYSGIHTCAVFDCYSPSRGVSIQPDQFLNRALRISAEEADVLQQLLLGTTLTQQETNK